MARPKAGSASVCVPNLCGGLTLRQSDKIKAFEVDRLATKPWFANTLAS